jgi:hypothetical protein
VHETIPDPTEAGAAVYVPSKSIYNYPQVMFFPPYMRQFEVLPVTYILLENVLSRFLMYPLDI